MSARISKDKLSDDQKDTIRQLLVMTPLKKNSHVIDYTEVNNEPIIFYLQDNNDILLPYMFYYRLTGIKPNQDKQFPCIQFEFTGKLFEYQIPLITQAYNQIKKYGTTLLSLYPGCGKTVLCANISSQLHVKVLVIYHRTTLGIQWNNTFKNMTSAKIIEMPIINLDQPWDVMLSMDTQIDKIPNNIKDQIGCVVIDEAHAFCTPSRVKCLLGIQPKYIIANTATPNREDGMFAMIESMVGLHQVHKPSQKRFELIRCLTNISPPLKQNIRGELDWNHLKGSLCQDETRNSYIIQLIQHHQDSKILVLTWLKSHAFLLQKEISNIGEKCSIMAGNLKVYKDCRILIGTISKIGTGFDEKSSCPDFNGVRINLLILVGTTKSETLIEQIFGRVFRSEHPQIIVLIDDVPVSKRHWYLIKRWSLQHNGQISDITMN